MSDERNNIQEEYKDVLDNEGGNVVDEADSDELVAPVQYDITSFGADYDVEGLVRRLERNDIYIPSFQRDYVWNMREASRFIESLLLGLPVPGIFLAKEPSSTRLLVIDGQQRLKSLLFFFKGVFNPNPESASQRTFRLKGVQKPFEGKTYEELDENDRRLLNDSIIHATIVKQEQPRDDDTSIYHIFERLNNSGRKLSPQQIRVAISHGSFMDTIKEMNGHPSWREIYGNRSPVLKDQELILRFLAFLHSRDTYGRPMSEFLNKFAMRRRNEDESILYAWKSEFERTINTVYESIGPKAFRPERALNAAVFDSTMVAIARRLESNPDIELDELKTSYEALLKNEDYLDVISQSTSDERSVERRMNMALVAFAKVK